jgi:rod shape-determining protein MreD
MIARLLLVGLLLVTVIVLQTALFPSLELFGFRPDLVLLLVLAVGLRDGAMSGLRVGFVAGLLADLLVTQAPVGLSVLVYSGIGFGAGLARPYLAPGSLTAPVMLAFASGVLGTAAYGVLALLLGVDRVTPALLVQASLTVGLYNTLLAPAMLGVVGRLSDRFPLRGPALVD